MAYQKNIHYLKEAIFSKLNGDATLNSLLGGSGRIFHINPPQEASYPCIVHAIVDDRDHPYNEQQETGKITTTNFRITIFSNNSTTKESDDIEARVKELLHGQRSLDNTKIICYSCYRDSLVGPVKDPDLQVWITPIRYRITWAMKNQS